MEGPSQRLSARRPSKTLGSHQTGPPHGAPCRAADGGELGAVGPSPRPARLAPPRSLTSALAPTVAQVSWARPSLSLLLGPACARTAAGARRGGLWSLRTTAPLMVGAGSRPRTQGRGGPLCTAPPLPPRPGAGTGEGWTLGRRARTVPLLWDGCRARRASRVQSEDKGGLCVSSRGRPPPTPTRRGFTGHRSPGLVRARGSGAAPARAPAWA